MSRTKLLPPCKSKLGSDAAKIMGRKTCGAQYPHHHCESCGFPINEEEFKDKKFCGGCAYLNGEE